MHNESTRVLLERGANAFTVQAKDAMIHAVDTFMILFAGGYGTECDRLKVRMYSVSDFFCVVWLFPALVGFL